MPRKNPHENPGYVTKPFCDERFLRVMDKLETIDGKVDDLKKKEHQEGRDWKTLILTVLSGAVVALITYGLTNLP